MERITNQCLILKSHYWTRHLLYSIQKTWQALHLKSTPQLVDTLSSNRRLKNCIHWILRVRSLLLGSLGFIMVPVITSADYWTNTEMGRMCIKWNDGTDHYSDNAHKSETQGSISFRIYFAKCLHKNKSLEKIDPRRTLKLQTQTVQYSWHTEHTTHSKLRFKEHSGKTMP